jgi:hypothetical protein
MQTAGKLLAKARRTLDAAEDQGRRLTPGERAEVVDLLTRAKELGRTEALSRNLGRPPVSGEESWAWTSEPQFGGPVRRSC